METIKVHRVEELLLPIIRNAKELIDEYRPYVDSEIEGETNFVFSKEQETLHSKKSALIALRQTQDILNIVALRTDGDCLAYIINVNNYINRLKEEIEKL